MTISTIPNIFYEFSFNADPNQNLLPPYWTDLSSRVQYGWEVTRGRQYELDANEAGLWKVELANSDGALDPGNSSSPYWPNVLPYRPCRIRMVLGNNLLTPDAASGGEWTPLAAGPAPAWVGVHAFGTGTATIASVGAQAYQGTQVWATTVPTGTAGADLLNVSVPQVNAGTTYTFTVQAQDITFNGQSPSCYAAIGWIGTNGQTISTSSGSPSTLVGSSGVWTQLLVTAQAPAGAVAAVLRVVTTTTPSSAITFWMDGLQLEARGYATPWQMPWKPGTNMLPRTIATGTETMAAGDSVSNWFFAPAGTTLGQATSVSAAPSGQTTAVTWTIPAGTYSFTTTFFAGRNAQDGGQNAVPAVDCVQVVPGQTYAASVFAIRTGTDATVNLYVSIWWFDVNGNVLSINNGASAAVPTSGWVSLAASSATAPAGAAWGRMSVNLPAGTLTGSEAVNLTGWQFQITAGVLTWADPGVTAFLFTGMVERWPRTWTDLGGTYGTSKLQCVDAFAALSQYPLADPYVNEILSYGPNFFYQLNDPATATTVVDTAARRVAAPVETGQTAGSLTFGSAVTSTNGGQAFTGTPGPVATFANGAGATFVSLHKTTTTPGPPQTGAWTRLLAFRTTQATGGTSDHYLWFAGNNAENIFEIVQFTSNTYLFIQYGDRNLAGFSANTPTINDGNWHLVAMGVNPATGVGTAWCDGVVIGTATGMSTPAFSAFDLLGAAHYPQNTFAGGYNGDLAHAVELPLLLTNAQMTALYNAWRSSGSGDSSAARYARVLRWISYLGATAIGTTSTASMGEANDTTGLTPLDALNAIATTENGDSYVNSAGTLTFNGRGALYGVRTPAAVFGENLPMGNAGEWPCEIGSIDYDPAHLANVVKVTQYQGPIYTATDATSMRRYFSRLYQRTINTTSGPEAQDAASYLVGQLKDPHQRADAIQLHPSAVLGLFPIVAQLDKNSRIRYIKRPPGGAPPTTLDGFIQRIAWKCSPDSDMYVEYQASPADLANYWKLGALHTTLSAQASSGQANATINALPDAATNKLAQSLPAGYSLTFEPGTPRAETIAIAPSGIPTTSLGYSTAMLTMASNFAFTHAAGSVVCEALPTGSTDPTAWDASSVLGASYAPILSGGGAGTNNVTVGPLPDSARNALGQTWNAGDVVQLSAGGTGIAETATILSVATTYPGYTSCVITFTANLAHSHPAGDYVSDIMPSTSTNPATWTAPTTRAAY